MGSHRAMSEINTERDNYECKQCGALVPARNINLMVHSCFTGLNTDEETIFLDRCCELFRGRKRESPGIVDLLDFLADREKERTDIIEEFTLRLRELLMKLPIRRRKILQKKILSILCQPNELPGLYNALNLHNID